MSQQIHVANSSEASVDPLRHTTDVVFVDDSGNPVDIGSGSSGTAVDAYTKSEADGRFAAKSDLDDKLSTVAIDQSTCPLWGSGTKADPLSMQLMMGGGLKVETGFLMVDMDTMQTASENSQGVVTLKQITDTVADKLTAAGVGAVTGDDVASVKETLNKLIAALS